MDLEPLIPFAPIIGSAVLLGGFIVTWWTARNGRRAENQRFHDRLDQEHHLATQDRLYPERSVVFRSALASLDFLREFATWYRDEAVLRQWEPERVSRAARNEHVSALQAFGTDEVENRFTEAWNSYHEVIRSAQQIRELEEVYESKDRLLIEGAHDTIKRIEGQLERTQAFALDNHQQFITECRRLLLDPPG